MHLITRKEYIKYSVDQFQKLGMPLKEALMSRVKVPKSTYKA